MVPVDRLQTCMLIQKLLSQMATVGALRSTARVESVTLVMLMTRKMMLTAMTRQCAD